MATEKAQAERPRDIFRAACAEISLSFGSINYRYLRSKSRIVKRDGDLRFEIAFATSPRNYIVPSDQRALMAESFHQYGHRQKLSFTAEPVEEMLQGSVLLSLRASVYSGQLSMWRDGQDAPLRTDDYVAGDEIGRLRIPPQLEDFNLAPKATRQQCIVEATALAHAVALPFFDQFRRPDDLIERLLATDLPGFWEALTFDYVLCFGGRALGLELLRRRLAGDSELQRRFLELLPQFQTQAYRESAAPPASTGHSPWGTRRTSWQVGHNCGDLQPRLHLIPPAVDIEILSYPAGLSRFVHKPSFLQTNPERQIPVDIRIAQPCFLIWSNGNRLSQGS